MARLLPGKLNFPAKGAVAMDSIDGFIVEVTNKRDAALTVFDNFIGHLKSIHGEIVRIAAEKDATERLAATERARLKTEMERSRKELDKLNLEIREARKTLERTIKEKDHHSREIGRILDDVMGRRSPSQKEKLQMPQVIYRGKSEAERIQDRLNNVHGSLRPNNVVETVPTRTITSTYHAAGHVPVRKYEVPDPVAAAVAAKGGITR